MFFFFFFNDTATTEIYTLSLHDALPIYRIWSRVTAAGRGGSQTWWTGRPASASRSTATSRTVRDRKSTRLNSSHANISYAVFCLKKKNKQKITSLYSRQRYNTTSQLSHI